MRSISRSATCCALAGESFSSGRTPSTTTALRWSQAHTVRADQPSSAPVVTSIPSRSRTPSPPWPLHASAAAPSRAGRASPNIHRLFMTGLLSFPGSVGRAAALDPALQLGIGDAARVAVPQVVVLVHLAVLQLVDAAVAAAVELVERIRPLHLEGELRQPLR